MVSLHRQRTSRRQRASHLHGLVNGDVYGSRILIATPTSLSHVRAIYYIGAGDNRTCTYFPYLRTCVRGIPHERRRTDIRKSCSPHPLIVDCLLAPPTYFFLAYARMRSVDLYLHVLAKSERAWTSEDGEFGTAGLVIGNLLLRTSLKIIT